MQVQVHRDAELRVPKDIQTTRAGTPANRSEAQVCRRSCILMRRTPACTISESEARARFRGSTAVPVEDVKTSPVSCQIRDLTLDLLSGEMLVQNLGNHCWDWDVSPRPCGLRWPKDHALPVDALSCLTHMEKSVFKINVRPSQAKQFPLPQPKAHTNGEECVQPVWASCL